jgi:glucose-6-phosphate 1-dehydrogenase
LGKAGLPEGSRIAVEKPFGEDLNDAVTLNALLAKVAGEAGEQMVFRVDHVLGMATVQDLLALRFANRVLQQMWNSTHIEQVDILWEETLALEGRAGYYDGTGALKDVMQNHMLQLFSLVAMEPPATLQERDVRDAKVEALRSVRPWTPTDAATRTRRARYTAGRLAGTGGASASAVPDYAAEDGVDSARGTETFAELTLEVDSPRWAGTRFVLRAGKALAARRKGVVVRFRPPTDTAITADATPNELWIGIDGPEDVALHLTGSADWPPRSEPLVLTAPPPVRDLPPYGRVLLEVLDGGGSRSVRGDEAEEAWRLVTPVLEAWGNDLVPLEEYPAGSAGPPANR